MQALPCRLVRGPLLLVCRRLFALASSSAALGCHVDVAFLGGAKSKAITPILEALSHSDPSPSPSSRTSTSTSSTSTSTSTSTTDNFPPLPSSSSQALAKLNRDGGITSVAVGNHSWGTTTTKKLVKLFPALEAIELVLSPVCLFLCSHRPSAVLRVPTDRFPDGVPGAQGERESPASCACERGRNPAAPMLQRGTAESSANKRYPGRLELREPQGHAYTGRLGRERPTRGETTGLLGGG
eukprot:scaffold8956_cov31-Phaeocystis_antarctica.AAC.4